MGPVPVLQSKIKNELQALKVVKSKQGGTYATIQRTKKKNCKNSISLH